MDLEHPSRGVVYVGFMYRPETSKEHALGCAGWVWPGPFVDNLLYVFYLLHSFPKMLWYQKMEGHYVLQNKQTCNLDVNVNGKMSVFVGQA